MNAERITNPFACDADQRLTQKSNAQLGRPHFGSDSPLYGAKHQSNAWGMPWWGGGGGSGDGRLWN